MRNPYRFAYPALALAVIAFSFAAVLIRKADAPALVIAAYRVALAAIPVGLLGLARDRARVTDRSTWRIPVIAAVCFATHLTIWNLSLQHTSVTASVVLRCTAPIFVGLASPFVLKERVSRSTWLGVAIAFAGALIMASNDLDRLGALAGDALAVVAGMFGAAYIVSGRLARPHTTNLAYLSIVYPLAAVLLIMAVTASGGSFTGYSATTFAALALLALIPTLIGHSAMNWSLGYIPAALVSVSVLAEPVLATLMAMAVLREYPTPLELLGGAVILTGIYVALRGSATGPVKEAAGALAEA